MHLTSTLAIGLGLPSCHCQYDLTIGLVLFNKLFPTGIDVMYYDSYD